MAYGVGMKVKRTSNFEMGNVKIKNKRLYTITEVKDPYVVITAGDDYYMVVAVHVM